MLDALRWIPVIAVASIPICIGLCVLIAVMWSEPPEDKGVQ